MDRPEAVILKKLKLFKSESGDDTAIVYSDREWEEYRVKFYHLGKHRAGCDYHTDDIDDAMDTAEVSLME